VATLSHLHTRCLSFVLLSSLAFVACEDDSSSSIGNQDAAAGGQQDASVDVAVKPDAAVDAPVTVDAVVDAAVDTVVDAANPCAVCSPNARCLVGGDAGGANTDAGGVCECNAGFEGNGLQCTAVAVSLSGLRWELPCAASTSANVCSVAGFTTKTTTMGGVPGALYALQLRFRGVVEQKTYTGGQADGYWYIGGASNGDAYLCL
jgi:hypothetical protein